MRLFALGRNDLGVRARRMRRRIRHLCIAGAVSHLWGAICLDTVPAVQPHVSSSGMVQGKRVELDRIIAGASIPSPHLSADGAFGAMPITRTPADFATSIAAMMSS